MKKLFTFITLVMVLAFSTPSLAIDPGFYIGVGSSYIGSDSTIEVSIDDVYETSIDTDDTYGLNLKFGYRINDLSSLEFDFGFLPSFEGEVSELYEGLVFHQIGDHIVTEGTFRQVGDYMVEGSAEGTIKAKGSITTYMISNKLHPNFGSETIRPFVIAGVGIMHSKVDVDVTGKAEIYTHGGSLGDTIVMSGEESIEGAITISDSETDFCGKIGAGIDFFVNENASVGFEGSYVVGFGDLEDIKYMEYTMGVAYHF